MPLTKKQIYDICLVQGGHKRCRYLAQDDSDWSKYYCLKKCGKKQEIDSETQEFIKDIKKKGQDPRKQSVPLGDNCSGYLIMKHIEQGYDKP